MSKPRVLLAAAVAVAAGAATLAIPSPASAGKVDAFCSAESNPSLTLTGTAFFTNLGAAIHLWPEFQYQLGGSMGNSSNVNIRLYDGNTRVYQFLSPDDRRSGQRYTERPAEPPQTSVANPETAFFEGIFDKWGYDPRCLAPTPDI